MQIVIVSLVAHLLGVGSRTASWQRQSSIPLRRLAFGNNPEPELDCICLHATERAVSSFFFFHFRQIE
jgi:hypothetical protein